MSSAPTGFNLSTVFATVAQAIPQHRAVIWRDREFSFAEMETRIDGFAHYLASNGLCLRTTRRTLQITESHHPDREGAAITCGKGRLPLGEGPCDRKSQHDNE